MQTDDGAERLLSVQEFVAELERLFLSADAETHDVILTMHAFAVDLMFAEEGADAARRLLLSGEAWIDEHDRAESHETQH